MFKNATLVFMLLVAQGPTTYAVGDLRALYHQGKTEQADAAVLQAAAEALASGHTTAAREALRALAHLAEEQWRYGLATQLNTQALTLAEETGGKESLAVAEVVGDLARLNRIDNRLPEAAAGARRALRLRAQLLGTDDAGAAQLLLIVAYAEWATDHFDEAEKLARRAIAAADRAQAPLEMASARSNLAVFLQWHGSLIEAERRYREALALYSKAGAERSPGAAVAAHNLVLVLATHGRITSEMAELEQTAATSAESSLGLRHPFTAELYDSLPRLYRMLGRGGRSVEAQQRAQLSRGKAAGWCVNDAGTEGCLRHCSVASLNDAGWVELPDGGIDAGARLPHYLPSGRWNPSADEGLDGGPVLVEVFHCPAHFECLALGDDLSVRTPAAQTVCAPTCPVVGKSTGCPPGWACSALVRDAGVLGYGVCAP